MGATLERMTAAVTVLEVDEPHATREQHFGNCHCSEDMDGKVGVHVGKLDLLVTVHV